MQGQLFTQDFLRRGVCETPAWEALLPANRERFAQSVAALFTGRDTQSVLNEAQTEQELILPLLKLLGWGDDTLPQVNLSAKGRRDVPDHLLFADAARKSSALEQASDEQRYRYGLAILEAKRWLRPLDRGDAAETADPDAPSSQMLRYLSRADVMSDRAVKWGLLTNGAVWRLYWQDARSRSEDFFEVDLAAALGLAGVQEELDAAPPAHALALFQLFFGRPAFLPQPWDADGRTLHAYALGEARLYEEKVSQDLGARVFNEVFPQLADALARGDLQRRTHPVGHGRFTRPQYDESYLHEVREAALVLLYRLLFLFYAEDRNLLPVRDARYADYSVRRMREEVRDKTDAGAAFSGTVGQLWLRLKGAFTLVDQGDDAIGMPAYNGGLFSRGRAPLLERTQIPDRVLAPLIDALSRRTEDVLRADGPPLGPSAPSGGSAARAAGKHGGSQARWINYRDLSVAHLGSIYERLLEYKLVHEVQARDDYKDKAEIDRIVAQPASFARKVSGSYYTHHDLVRLVLRESVGRLADEKIAAFEKALDGWKKRATLTPPLWDKLDGSTAQAQRDAIDPATQMLEFTVCDPAMGSGHFLVALVDLLADRVLEAASRASALVALQPWAAHLAEQGRAWQSPVIGRIAAIRREIQAQARTHGWAVTDAQLDDRHIVRRMILKKCVFGVDKNPMAVELAKTSLWLHTFTVGAPLSFLDHHLKLGDSLHGERLDAVERGLQALGMLFQQGELKRLQRAAEGLAQVADLTDVDMAEARQSQQLARDAAAQLAPIHALLDFWRALRWLVPGWPVGGMAALRRLFRLPADDAACEALLAQGAAPHYLALRRLLGHGTNVVSALGDGVLTGSDADTRAANALLDAARALAEREHFLHWWSTFPTVFGADGSGGFDVVVANPPWDRIKLQQVEWFAERDPAIASQPRAADRKAMIEKLLAGDTPLATDYRAAVERAEANARVLTKAGDYPLMGGGDVNLYSLFVERAASLVRPDGVVALITPSGIAADKGAAPFFRSLSETGRLGVLYDFENRKVFFPDVHASFKFCVIVFGGPERRFAETRCAFFLHAVDELAGAERTLALGAADFARVNPNTGAAPIFRSRRDADITLGIYARHPVLVRHTARGEEKTWPVKYLRMFDMTNDSDKFRKPAELEQGGWQRAPLNHWRKGGAEALPLYVGKMIWHFDHRAASVTELTGNLKVSAGSAGTQVEEHSNPEFYAQPQYWVQIDDLPAAARWPWALAFRDITNATNARTMVAAVVPTTCAGNTMPLLLPGDEQTTPASWARSVSLLLANLCSMALDYAARQKAQGTHLNWYTVEQLPVIAPARFDDPLPAAFAAAARAAGWMNGARAEPTVADFILAQVLALSYTAHDLAAFARDLGYVDAEGAVRPPVVWNDGERRERLAALDALFFWLYGLGADDAEYVLGTFPIIREQDQRAFGRWRTRDDVLRWLALLG